MRLLAPSSLLALLGFLLLAALHVFRLGGYPALHFDEAWAMSYSWRIAIEPGFWPLEAMSPYTAPWAHYWAALWLNYFGPSMLVFRASQAALSFAGLLALYRALPLASRFLFPWAALLLPGLLLNHRFAIELTGLHALCFGLVALGIARRNWGLALAAALVGTTGHVLFYGVALGLLFAVLVSGGGALLPRLRYYFAAYFLATALFLLRVAFLIPEKGKAAALVLSALAAAALLLAGGERWPLWRSHWWRRALPALAAVFVVNAVFFGQGYWTSSIYTGLDIWSLYPSYPPLSFVLGFLTLLLGTALALLFAPAFTRAWFLASTLALGVMMLKPAPRYYELVLLGLAALFVVSVGASVERGGWAGLLGQGRQRWLRAGVAIALLLAAHLNFEMSRNLFDVNQLIGTKETSLRFLAFKDSSRDFLGTPELARFLGSSGCKFGDIEVLDPRILESLRALSLGDWPESAQSGQPCPWARVARKSLDGAAGDPWGEFLLQARAAKGKDKEAR